MEPRFEVLQDLLRNGLHLRTRREVFQGQVLDRRPDEIPSGWRIDVDPVESCDRFERPRRQLRVDAFTHGLHANVVESIRIRGRQPLHESGKGDRCGSIVRVPQLQSELSSPDALEDLRNVLVARSAAHHLGTPPKPRRTITKQVAGEPPGRSSVQT